jgi:hypothetical protein
MITAIDTDILLDILVPNQASYDTSASALFASTSRPGGSATLSSKAMRSGYRD